jgi:predicted GIY-YIG superfamily endonuclease
VSFFVYILRCRDYSYYVGHTDDLERRMAQHDAGEFPGYTEGRRPLRLVFAQEFPTREEALAAERRLKGWSRAKKEALIMQNWDRLRLLARSGKYADKQGGERSLSTSSGRTDASS